MTTLLGSIATLRFEELPARLSAIPLAGRVAHGLVVESTIWRRLTKSQIPRTNGLVARLNGPTADVLRIRRLGSSEGLVQSLLQAMKDGRISICMQSACMIVPESTRHEDASQKTSALS